MFGLEHIEHIEKELRRLEKAVVVLIKVAEEQNRLLREVLHELRPKKTYQRTVTVGVKII